jgi:hypothetical protein
MYAGFFVSFEHVLDGLNFGGWGVGRVAFSMIL